MGGPGLRCSMQLQISSFAPGMTCTMDDYFFSQGKGTASATTTSLKRSRRVRRFNPPLKKSQSQDSESVPSQYSVAATGVAGEEGRVHTVLSYCNETSNTQPEEQFMQSQLQSQQDEIAGEELLRSPKGTVTVCSSELLDDSLLSDRGDNVLSTEGEEMGLLDDVISTSPQRPWYKSSNQFRVPSGSKNTVIDYEDHPLEPQSRDVCKEGPNVDGECSEPEEAVHLSTRRSVIPRRTFKVPRPKTSAYNFSVVPKELIKTAAKRRQPPGLVCKRRPRLKTGFAPPNHTTHNPLDAIIRDKPDKAQGELSVFEFHASQEQSRAAGKDDSEDGGDLERVGDSRSRIDVSLSTRTREEQLAIDLEVLQVIAKTRAEIRAIRAKYAAMKARRVPAVGRRSDPTSAQPFHSKVRQLNRLEWRGLKEE